MEGNVTFSDVVFNYPTQPDIPVLQGLSLQVIPVQHTGQFRWNRELTRVMILRLFRLLAIKGSEISKIVTFQENKYLVITKCWS